MLNKVFNFFKKNCLIFFAYIILFIILSSKVSKLKLLLDDNVHIFPALIKNYNQYIKDYFYGYGFFRPLALLFFSFIYNFYIISPNFSHLFIFCIHFLTGILLAKAIENIFERKISYLISLFFISFPFFTEQYGWLAASNAVITNLFLVIQIYIVTNKNLQIKTKLKLIFLLQFIGIMFYESIFFTFIPIAIILANIEKESLLKRSFFYSFILSVPSLVYYFIRNFIFPAHNLETIRNIGFYEFINGKWLNFFTINLQRLFNDISFLFLSKGAIIYFWNDTLMNGINNLFSEPLLITLLGIFILLLIFYIIKENQTKNYSIKLILYPLLFSILSLIPALLVKTPSFPFRVIALPLFFFTSVLFIFIYKLSYKLSYFLVTIFIILNVIMSQQMLIKMKNQSIDDANMINTIVSYLNSNLKENQKTQIEINEIPHSTQTEFTYGEYLGSCLTIDWCINPLINKYTNKVSKIFINNNSSSINNKNKIIKFRYNKITHQLLPLK